MYYEYVIYVNGYKMKKVLIIGENSYIGESFIKATEEKGMDITVVSSFDDKWKEADFSDFDSVLHVAGLAHVSKDKSLEPAYYKINRDLAIEAAEYAKKNGAKQFVFMSSIIIYGKDGRIGEKRQVSVQDYAPEDFYGDSKLQADLAIQKSADENFKTVVIRTPMVYGESCKGNFPKLIKAARKLPFFPDIQNERSMIYIGNLTEFIRLAIENEISGVFYPQNSEYVCTSKAVRDMAALCGKKMRLTKIFNPILSLLSKRVGFINKVFGSKTYDLKLSDTFDGKYNIYDYEESLKRVLGL